MGLGHGQAEGIALDLALLDFLGSYSASLDFVALLHLGVGGGFVLHSVII